MLPSKNRKPVMDFEVPGQHAAFSEEDLSSNYTHALLAGKLHFDI